MIAYNTIMKIGLDFDGVISDYPKMKRGIYKELFNMHLSDAQVFYAGKILPDDDHQKYLLGYNDEEINNKHLDFALDAKVYIKKLIKEHHHLKVVTARHKDNYLFAKNLLNRHGIFIDLEYTTNGPKDEHLKEFDVFLDDSFKHLLEVKEVVKHKFLFTNPRNADADITGVAKRINSWKEFYEELSKL